MGDEMPNYLDDTYDPEIGINVWCFPMTDNEILDGVIGDFSFSKNFTNQEIERLEPLIAERGIEEITLMGWEFENTEVWFYGDLIIEKNYTLIWSSHYKNSSISASWKRMAWIFSFK